MKNVLIAFLLFQIQWVVAQNAIVDETFGSSGYASTIRLVNRDFKKVFQTQDSGFIAVGEYQSTSQTLFTAVKFNKTGQLDLSFGSAGVYNIALLPNSQITVNTACSTQDNSILICGTSYQYNTSIKNIFILKLKIDGHIDSTFGSDGIKLELAGYTNSFIFIKEDRHRKIIVGQMRTVGGTPSNCYLVKLKSNGEIDSSFQNQGELTMNGQGYAYVKNFEVTEDNHYLVSYFNAGAGNPIYANLDSNGNFNNKFGSYGKMYMNVSPLNSSYTCGTVPIANNGFFLYVLLGIKSNQSSLIIVHKYKTIGQLDSSYGRNGITSNYLTSQIHLGLDFLKIDNKNRIILGMRFYDSCSPLDPDWNNYYCDYTSAIYRFNSKGRPDSTFNSTGIFNKFKDYEFDDELSDIVVQNDNKIVVVGKVSVKGQSLKGFMCRLNAFYPTANMSVGNTAINNINLYPMPFTDKINFEGVNGMHSIKIYSMLGQLVYQEKTNDPIIANLGFLSTGNYILEVENENNTTYRYKILKSE